MAWHLPYRPTPLHYAVSTALLCVIGTTVSLPTATAATLGKTTITSAQHEPLVAVISVSDIQSPDFSASLANAVVYQQMGLTPTDSMSVNFIATSATTGQVMISTSQPVSKPFADVVLAINDNGQNKVVPKTLLMPLGASAPAKAPNRMIASATKPNLPVVSASVATPALTAANNVKPLALKSGTPPPLFESSTSAPATQMQAQSNTNKALSSVSLATASNLPAAATPLYSIASAPPDLDMSTNNTSFIANTNTLKIENNRRVSSRSDNTLSANNNASMANNLIAEIVETANASTAVSSAGHSNVQQQLLTKNQINNSPVAVNDSNKLSSAATNSTLDIQVTRQISVRNSPINQVDSTDSPALALDFGDSLAALNSADMTKTDTADIQAAAIEENQQDSAIPSDELVTSASSKLANSDAALSDSAPMISYTVQRNDNLWIISKQIAEQNNLDISAVMNQIKKQNPNAFINKNADQLKANAELRLPNYEVIPSQSNIQAAIAAQKARYIQAKKLNDNNSDKAKAELSSAVNESQSTSAVAQTATSKQTKALQPKSDNTSPKTTTQKLPQARFSVVAPTSKGQADGSQTKSATGTGNSNSNADNLDTNVLASLQSSRKSTAAQAQRVKSISSTLGSYTQKLQLQNQKLAELEARLKKLRNQ